VCCARNPASYGRGRGLVSEVFLNVGRRNWQHRAFTKNPNFPNSPDIRLLETQGTSTPPYAFGDYYGNRLTGLFVAPTNAWYSFYVKGDDWVRISMNIGEAGTDDTTDAAHLTVLATSPYTHTFFDRPGQVSAVVLVLCWRGGADNPGQTCVAHHCCMSQISRKVWLTKGQKYFTEILHTEHRGRARYTVAMRIHSAPAAGNAEAGSAAAAIAAGGGWVTNSDQQMLASPREMQRVSVTSSVVRELHTLRLSGVRGRFRIKATWTKADGSTATGLTRFLSQSSHPNTIVRELRKLSTCSSIRVGRRWHFQRISYVRRGRTFYRNRRAGFIYTIQYNCAPVSDEKGHAQLEIVQSSLKAWGGLSADMGLVKTRSASPAVGGAFRLGFRGEWTEFLPFNANWKQVKTALESLDTVDKLRFVYDDRTPADARSFRVGFSQAGNMPDIQVDASRLQGADMEVKTLHDGSIDGFFSPIPADLFEIPEATPGVQVFTNGIPAQCSSPSSTYAANTLAESKTNVSPMPEFYQLMDPSDDKCEECLLSESPLADAPADVRARAASVSDICSFAFDDALTPTLTSVAPAVVTAGASLTVTGQGFLSGRPSEHTVLLRSAGDAGTSACAVTAASATQLTCTVDHAVAGDLDVVVIVGEGRGQARGSAGVQYQGQLEAVTPSVGSIAGGTLVTLSGTGFPASVDAAASFTVNIGAGVCTLESSSFTQATCRTPALADAASSSGMQCEGMSYEATAAASFTGASLLSADVRCTTAWAVSATSMHIQDSVTGFTFAASHTPTITSMSPSDASAATTTPITLQGSLLVKDGSSASVSFGDVSCNADHSPDGSVDVAEQITCVVPRGAGLCGRGDHTSAHTLNPELVAGSSEGHHRRLRAAQAHHHRRLSGGDSDECSVAAQMQSSSATVVVPGYGAALVLADATLNHGFHITSVYPSTGSLAGGATIRATGSFFVPARADEHTASLTVTLASGVEKFVNCRVTTVSSTALECVVDATPASISSSDAALSSTFSVAFGGYSSICSAADGCGFTLAPAATPQVSSASVSHAPAPSAPFDAATFTVAPSVLTLALPGLTADAAAATTVTVGGVACPLTASSAGTVTCAVAHDRAGVVDIAVSTPTGFATAADASVLKYEHALRIDFASPLAGSLAGGQRVTLFGMGLAGADGAAPQVWFGNPDETVSVPSEDGDSTLESLGVQAVVESASPTMVVVRAPAFPAALTPVAAKLQTDGARVFIDTTGTDFNFKWQTDMTPVVSAMSPQQGSAGDLVTFTGTGFSGAEVTVAIGGVACTGASVVAGADGSEAVQCTMGAVPGGSHADIVVDVAGKGYASFGSSNGRRLSSSDSDSLSFASVLEVTSVENSSGGVAGGWDLHINGRGFPSNPSDASVLVCGQPCTPTASSYSQLTCKVPSMRSAASMAKFSSIYDYGRGDDFLTSAPGRDIRQKLMGDVRSRGGNFQAYFDGNAETGATTGNRFVLWAAVRSCAWQR